MYDGSVHPEVWLKKIETYCYKNQITDALEFSKSMIHPSINVSDVDNFDELIEWLKEDVSFISFKNSVKRRFKPYEYNFECNEDGILKSLNQFRQRCYEGEITEIEEQKNLLLNVLQDNYFQYNFIKKNLDKINSMDDLLKYFDQSMLEKKTCGYRKIFI